MDATVAAPPSPDEARETLLAELREIVVPDKKHRAIVREALVLIELDGAVRSELDARERSLGLMASERDEAVQTARSLAREVEANDLLLRQWMTNEDGKPERFGDVLKDRARLAREVEALRRVVKAAWSLDGTLTDEEWANALGPMSYDGRRPSVPEQARVQLGAALSALNTEEPTPVTGDRPAEPTVQEEKHG